MIEFEAVAACGDPQNNLLNAREIEIDILRRLSFAQDAALPQGAMFGALGANAARLTGTGLPAALRHTLPALRVGEAVFAVPRMVQFAPAMPAACASFATSPDGWAGVDGWGCEDEAATLC